MSETISIIVPALNEEALIAETLGALALGDDDELIVVDGASSDATVSIASRFTHKVITAPRGRAFQMNAGAKAASRDILIFLHADCLLPDGGLDMVRSAFEVGASAAAFDIQIAHEGFSYRLIERAANLRSRITRLAYGDQAISIRRDLFDRMGGFSDIPLMEDVEFGLRLRRQCAVRFMRPAVRVSARRWAHEGPLYTTLRDWRLALSYLVLRTSPDKLISRYRDIR